METKVLNMKGIELQNKLSTFSKLRVKATMRTATLEWQLVYIHSSLQL